MIGLIAAAARRLWANRRLALGLVAGFTVAVAAASSIPVFTGTSLQRVLQAELAASTQRQPAAVYLSYFPKGNRRPAAAQHRAADGIARTQGPGLLGLPVQPFVRYGSTDLTAATPVDRTRVNPNITRWLSLAFQSDLEQEITLIDGRLPSAEPRPDGSLEVLVEEAALDKQDFTVGAELTVPLGRGETAPKVTAVVVGAFERTQPDSPYWFQATPFEQQLFVPEPLFQRIAATDGAELGQQAWYFGVATADLRINDAVRFLGSMYELEARMAQAMPGTELFGGPMELLTRFIYRANALQYLLLLLDVPLMAVVAYFILVTSGMIVDGQRQEIAVLRSRGASLVQVIALYGLEGLLLAGVSLAAGYPLGVGLARLMGLSVGFLEFVDRRQPEVQLSPEFWLFGLAAALLSLAAYVGPALPAASRSIVGYKQESARDRRVTAWARLGLDLLLLGLAGYAYYSMTSRSSAALAAAVGEAAAGPSDPLQILAPALFIIGASLALLRLIPLLVRAVALIADRWAGAPLYLALTQLGRAASGYRPVVLLLSLTVGIGLYNAAAARTLERNMADRLWYGAGADVRLDEVWEFDERESEEEGLVEGDYIPPPWDLHYSLPGVLHPARVRLQEVTPSVGGRSQRKAALMAIDPQDFGRVAWFRRDLLPFHLNDYLNLLARDEEAVLVSTGFAQRSRLSLGDRITLGGAGGQEVSLVVYGTVAHWPALYPQKDDFMVANLYFIEANLGLQPYQVWLKLEPGARLQPVIDGLKAQSVLTVGAVDYRQKLIQSRRDPYLNGLMGGLTTGFLLSALLTVLGFWLHAALSARARLLQFGVLRALGLTGPQLTGAVIFEQLVSATIGIGAGTGLGLTAAWLFVPFLQRSGDGTAQTPPFLIMDAAEDRARLYALLALMLLVSVLGLVLYLARLRIHEAVKLGEDH